MNAQKKNTDHDDTESTKIENVIPTCGIVRPIAAMESYTEAHWRDVHNILEDAIKDAEFKPNLVSNANEINIIHKTIVENLYTNEMIVCDISGKNPNVMLELGMRLAFDKPTIVIKDNTTPFSFDTSPIEHLIYPRDLRFAEIVEFKKKLSKKIQDTFKKSSADSEYSTFLKHFGDFTVVKINQKEISKDDYIIQSIQQLTRKIEKLESSRTSVMWEALAASPETGPIKSASDNENTITFEFGRLSREIRKKLFQSLIENGLAIDVYFSPTKDGSITATIQKTPNTSHDAIFNAVTQIVA